MVGVVVARAVGDDEVGLELADLLRHEAAGLVRGDERAVGVSVDVVAVQTEPLRGLDGLRAARLRRLVGCEPVVAHAPVGDRGEPHLVALGEQLHGEAAAGDVRVVGMRADHHHADGARRARDRARGVGAGGHEAALAHHGALAGVLRLRGRGNPGRGHKGRTTEEISSVKVHVGIPFL